MTTLITKKIANKLKYEVGKIDKLIKERRLKKTKERIATILRNKPVVKLHVGCGPRVLKGWVNIDIAYQPYGNHLKYFTDKHYSKEIRGDKNDFLPIDIPEYGLPFPDNSVDVIFHEDFLEHIPQRDQIAFLSESLRVLKKGGIHRVNTPNLTASMRDHSDFSKGMHGVYFAEWDKHKHINVLTPFSLKEMALMVGYSEVIFNERDASVSKLVPSEYRPAGDRPESDGNIFADLIK